MLRPLYDLQTRGVSVDFVPADRQGNIRYEDMETLFRPETKAVVCTHASNLTGNLLDIAKIGAMAHAHGALLVVDASQTAGAVPIDMQRMNIDVLCFTGHKGLMGPQGTGGLCIRPGVELRPLLRHSLLRPRTAAGVSCTARGGHAQYARHRRTACRAEIYRKTDRAGHRSTRTRTHAAVLRRCEGP